MIKPPRRPSTTLLVATPRWPASGLGRPGRSAVSPTGVLGDPAGASAEEGAVLLDALVRRLVAAATAWRVDTIGRLAE